jgi:hypothetical protein
MSSNHLSTLPTDVLIYSIYPVRRYIFASYSYVSIDTLCMLPWHLVCGPRRIASENFLVQHLPWITHLLTEEIRIE